MIRKTVLTTIALLALLCARVQAAPTASFHEKESGFKHELKSPHGAVGVFQLLPSTANRMGFNPYYLSENIKAGLTYYKMMYKMFGSTELALAAYNAGPGNVKKFGGTIPPYSETKRFVSQIMLEYNRQKTNPDPAIAKVTQAKAQMPEKETEAKNPPKEFELPNLREIPEVKHSEPVMEIL